jgi:hypothetical protein
LADVAHFDLPARGVGGSVGEDNALEGLDHHVLWGAFDGGAAPVGFGDGEAGGVEPRVDEGFDGESAVCAVDGTGSVEEVPDNARDVVVGSGVVVEELGARDVGLGGVVTDDALAVDGLGRFLAAAVGGVVVARVCVGDALEGEVGGGEGVTGVTGHGDAGVVAADKGVDAGLHAAGDKLNREEAVGGEAEHIGGGGVGVVDLHASFVEILDQVVGASWGAVGVRFGEGDGVGAWAPEPGALDLTVFEGEVDAVPEELEDGVSPLELAGAASSVDGGGYG